MCDGGANGGANGGVNNPRYENGVTLALCNFRDVKELVEWPKEVSNILVVVVA